MNGAAVLMEKATNLANLNLYLAEVRPPERLKRAILALHQADVISEVAAELLIEKYELEAIW